MANSQSLVPLSSTFEPYLQDLGKGRGGEGGNYRRNVSRELERFAEWAAGDRGGEEWTGIVDGDRDPPVSALDAGVFRKYARHLDGNRGLKQNTVQTYYAFISAWCGWCVTEGYIDAHYAQRAEAQDPLPDDDGRRPGDQQAWTPEQRHRLTRHVDEAVHSSVDALGDLPDDAPPAERQRVEYEILRAMRDRALVYLLAYTAVRAGELLRDRNDPRRRGVRWEDITIDESRMDVYRKKQSWDTASLPDPVTHPLKQYQKRLDSPSETWPVFPTFDYRTLGELVADELATRGFSDKEIETARDEYSRDLFLALDRDIQPQSITTEGARTVLKRLTADAEIDVSNSKHDYLAPHGGRRGMGEVLVRAFGYTVAARYLDNSEEMVRKRYSHIEAGELGDKVSEALTEYE